MAYELAKESKDVDDICSKKMEDCPRRIQKEFHTE